MPLDDEDWQRLENDYQRKRVRLPPARPVQQVLSELLAKKGYAQVQTAAQCAAAWRAAVGEKLAAHTRPGNVSRGVLEVMVRNSAVLQELSFLKVNLIQSLTKSVPEQKIRNIRFRVGPVD